MIISGTTKQFVANIEPKVVIETDMEIVGYGTLPIEIIGDFTNIPEQHHENFMRAMMSRYNR